MDTFAHISSLKNPIVGSFRALHTRKGREEDRSVLLEGPHLFLEVLRAAIVPQILLFDPDEESLRQFHPDIRRLALRGTQVMTASTAVIGKMSDAQTPQGIVMQIGLPDISPETVRSRRGNDNRPIVIILDDLSDPGNVGTILRTALATDVDQVYCTPHCVDIYSPKVMRSAIGAHFFLPIQVNTGWSQMAVQFLKSPNKPQIVVADSHAVNDYTTLDLTHPTIFIIGNEAHGPSIDAISLANLSILIPMYNGVESLNAAMATGVLLYEAVRQRILSERRG